jgi:hypothetical protein
MPPASYAAYCRLARYRLITDDADTLTELSFREIATFFRRHYAADY